VEKYSDNLRCASKHLKDISGMDCEGWSLLKIATALKLVWYPDKRIVTEAVFR
jgi:nucleolar protein 58